ncbi:LysR substrate-binding domain-containing protein [Paracraurococcus ruber]|uniref:HTH lysR-type domain-containing protein n=1 Tax=Paracraurococcus ruber TaxID=77675 RepID=A0ABS1D0R3_9PROT|nr:LysR substrate-binding domain-containing protein [Paracraurococcus ruber]MBK1659872.1 hypothetical protein [Paracraurococcus ruber]TDG28182.1 LysR family transcriptional regulator [Paracraurococcus ruber]
MSPVHASLGGLPLLALRAFEAAARHGSFQAGAAEIGLTPSAVSHHVRQLEASLGVALFDRLHRRVALTEAGRTLADALGEGFRRIAVAYAAAQAPRGRLVVSATPSFAARWLVPAMATLRAEGIDLDIEGTAAAADIEGGACDVAIRLGPRPSGRLVAEALATSPLVLVAAPARLAGRAALAPDEIVAGPLLSITLAPRFWAEVLQRLGVPPQPLRDVRLDSFDAALQAAEAGHGLAYAPEIVVADRLAAGTLVAIHPRRFGRRRGWSYWFVARPEVAQRPPVRRLKALLIASLASAGGQEAGER